MKFLLMMILMVTMACAKLGGTTEESEPAEKFNPDGNEQGNGTDNPPVDLGSAWFFEGNSSSIIKYCYVKSPTFPVSSAQIESDLAKAFQLWQDYYHSKDIYRRTKDKYIAEVIAPYPEPYRSEVKKNAELVAPYFKIATYSRLERACNGQEDLKFYFGVTSSEVEAGLKKFYDPTAFALRTSFDAYRGWGKGFVWLSEHLKDPNRVPVEWNLPYRLRGILTHEIGHIYGMGHIEGTIMRPDMTVGFGDPRMTTQPQEEVEYILQNIDNEHELFSPSLVEGGYNYNGAQGLYSLQDEKNFMTFGGRKPEGTITSRFKDGAVDLTDSKGTIHIPLKIEKASVRATDYGSLFKVWRMWSPTELGTIGGGTQLSSNQEVYLASAKDSNNQTVVVEISKNGFYSGLLISYFLNDRRCTLFVADGPFVF